MSEENKNIVDLIMCADINLDNLAKVIPGLDKHPYFQIVKMQLKDAMNSDDAQRAQDES